MSIEKIVAKILGDAEQQVRAIYDAGFLEVEAKLAKAGKEARERQAALIRSAETRSAETESRAVTAARLEARKNLLATKQELMEAVFTQALVELRAAPVHEQRAFLKRLLIEAVSSGKESVVCASEDAALFGDGLLDELNAALRADSKLGQVSLSTEHRATGGGFYLVGDGLEINVTYPTLLKAVREQLEPEVATILFR